MAHLHAIDCPAEYLERAIAMAIASAKRQMNDPRKINLAMKQLWDQDIKIYTAAALSIRPLTEKK